MLRKILVVDDSPELLGLIGQRLRERGFEVATAEDGESALESARRAPPDLVLLDVVMPKKSGWEVARAIKLDPALRRIKIIIMTALGEELNDNASPLFGADATLDKPFDLGQLDRAIDAMAASLASG
jgi:CheY-like chemotaxis protein